MKYYIEYPLLYLCNLQCPYCFHKSSFERGYAGYNEFTVQQYNFFREKHLSDADEILIHFTGAEPFYRRNLGLMEEFLENTEFEFVDILTNGLLPWEKYERILKPFSKRVHRIGFTFHRKMIGNNKETIKTFENNVLSSKKLVANTYVKEMLFTTEKDAIVSYGNYWKGFGIDFKVQDFKGFLEGPCTFDPANKYEFNDLSMIDKEYLNYSSPCACKPGYKTLIIRGAWRNGDVLACKTDQKVVGNIQLNIFNKDYYVIKEGGPEVLGMVPVLYRGDISVKGQIQNTLELVKND